MEGAVAGKLLRERPDWFLNELEFVGLFPYCLQLEDSWLAWIWILLSTALAGAENGGMIRGKMALANGKEGKNECPFMFLSVYTKNNQSSTNK